MISDTNYYFSIQLTGTSINYWVICFGHFLVIYFCVQFGDFDDEGFDSSQLSLDELLSHRVTDQDDTMTSDMWVDSIEEYHAKVKGMSRSVDENCTSIFCTKVLHILFSLQFMKYQYAQN